MSVKFLGKRIFCPRCQTPFMVAEEIEAIPLSITAGIVLREPASDSWQADFAGHASPLQISPPAGQGLLGWKRAATGMAFHQAAVLALAAATFCAILLVLLAMTSIREVVEEVRALQPPQRFVRRRVDLQIVLERLCVTHGMHLWSASFFGLYLLFRLIGDVFALETPRQCGREANLPTLIAGTFGFAFILAAWYLNQYVHLLDPTAFIVCAVLGSLFAIVSVFLHLAYVRVAADSLGCNAASARAASASLRFLLSVFVLPTFVLCSGALSVLLIDPTGPVRNAIYLVFIGLVVILGAQFIFQWTWFEALSGVKTTAQSAETIVID